MQASMRNLNAHYPLDKLIKYHDYIATMIIWYLPIGLPIEQG